MNEREKLLNRIQVAGFSMWELHLFLDTHPTDQAAMKMYEESQRKYFALVQEFESKYGPLKTASVTQNTMWQWLKDPWPWDYVEGR